MMLVPSDPEQASLKLTMMMFSIQNLAWGSTLSVIILRGQIRPYSRWRRN